jgi:hypothetical protein
MPLHSRNAVLLTEHAQSNISAMFIFNSAVMSASDLDKRVAEFKRNSETPVQAAEPTFGQKLTEAVKRRVHNRRAGFMASASAEGDDSFGEKLKKAVQKHPKSKEQEQKTVEKERARYRKPQTRQPTKGE